MRSLLNKSYNKNNNNKNNDDDGHDDDDYNDNGDIKYSLFWRT